MGRAPNNSQWPKSKGQLCMRTQVCLCKCECAACMCARALCGCLDVCMHIHACWEMGCTSGWAMTKGRRQWSPMARLTARTPMTRTPFQNSICPPAASTLACNTRHPRKEAEGQRDSQTQHTIPEQYLPPCDFYPRLQDIPPVTGRSRQMGMSLLSTPQDSSAQRKLIAFQNRTGLYSRTEQDCIPQQEYCRPAASTFAYKTHHPHTLTRKLRVSKNCSTQNTAKCLCARIRLHLLCWEAIRQEGIAP